MRFTVSPLDRFYVQHQIPRMRCLFLLAGFLAASVLGGIKEREAASVFMRQANAAFSEGRPRDAVPLYQQALRIQPDRLAGHMNLGVTFHSMGNLGAAVESYHTVRHGSSVQC